MLFLAGYCINSLTVAGNMDERKARTWRIYLRQSVKRIGVELGVQDRLDSSEEPSWHVESCLIRICSETLNLPSKCYMHSKQPGKYRRFKLGQLAAVQVLTPALFANSLCDRKTLWHSQSSAENWFRLPRRPVRFARQNLKFKLPCDVSSSQRSSLRCQDQSRID